MTNNELIWLNAGHPSITQHKSRAERYAQLCGLFAHELGHVLYTDFITSQTHLTRLDSGFWYPEPPPLRTSREQHAEEELWDYETSSAEAQDTSPDSAYKHDLNTIYAIRAADGKKYSNLEEVTGLRHRTKYYSCP